MKKITVDSFLSQLYKAKDLFFEKVEEINSINYFPVVDHDTGANMYATLDDALNSSKKNAQDLVRDLVLFSKGNSGIILGNALSGFLSVLISKGSLKNAGDFYLAVRMARDCAYDAVAYPKEKTILTFLDIIAQDIDWNSEHSVRDTMNYALEQTLVNGEYDAGAKGIYYLIEFIFNLGLNTNIEIHTTIEHISEPTFRYKYCTELVIDTTCTKEDISEFIQSLDSVGDSVAKTQIDNILKIHVHNNNPFYIFEKATVLGKIMYKKIDNMSLENGNCYPVIFVIDSNDFFAPLTKYNVEYISLSSLSGNKELDYKVKSINAQKIIFLTDYPEKYDSNRYENVFFVKTFGLFSKISVLLFSPDLKNFQNYLEDIQSIARICQTDVISKCRLSDEQLEREADYLVSEEQILDLFSVNNDACWYVIKNNE